MHRTRLLASLAVCLALTPAACAHGMGELVKSGAEAGVGGALAGLDDPRNKEMLVRLLKDPDIQDAAHDLTAALTGGALDGLTDQERQTRIREASDAYIRTVAASLAKALNQDITPALEKVVGGVVASALRPGNRALAEAMVGGVTRSAIDAFADSTAAGLRDDIGPALQQVIEDDLRPALRKIIDEDLQPAMTAALGGEDGGAAGGFARALTKQIVLGVNDGMSELGISPVPNGTKAGGFGLMGWLLVGFAALLVILIVVVIRGILNRRALVRDRVRSEEMLVNILRAIKTTGPEAQADIESVMARVHQSMPDLDRNAYLASIVGRAQMPAREAAPAKPKIRVDDYRPPPSS